MRTRTTLIGALFILLAGAAVAKAQQPDTPAAETLTLERAIQLALEGNRPVKNARLDVENFADRVAELRTKRLPSFKVTTLVAQPLTPFELHFEKGVFGDIPGTGPVPNEDTTISSSMKPTALLQGQITQPLSQLHRINLGIRQAELTEELGAQELRRKEQAVVNDVKRA